jgi:hypothetical protein
MKSLIISLIMLLLIPSVCFAEWTKEDTAYQLTFTSLVVVDWGQTRWMAKHDWKWDGNTYHEINPFLSSKPSVREVDVMVPLGIIAHAVVSYLLPSKYKVLGYKVNPRRMWQVGGIALESGMVVNNASLGVGFEF